MPFFKLWRWGWRTWRRRRAPLRREARMARLAVEALEDRLALSTTGPLDPAYEAWRQQTFRIDDIRLIDDQPAANDLEVNAGNATFGALIGLPAVSSNTSYRGAGYGVAVIDTGIDYRNASLGGGFGPGHRVVAGWDFANNDADPMDDNGHGTHVAGIVGSASASHAGVAPEVNLIALKVLSASGSGTYGNVESALQWVIAHRAQYNIVAVNLSLGSGNYTTNPYTFLSDEFTTLKNAGVFISVAAGNSYGGTAGLGYPAVDPQVVSVGAVYAGNVGSVTWSSGARDNTTAADRVASFSQRGSALSILAPGAFITSTYLNNTYKSMAGTSMAAPVVAGAAVLIHQAMDSLHLAANQNSILALMKNTGVNVIDGDDEDDNVANTGLTFKRLNLYAALTALGAPANAAPVLQAIGNVNLAPGGSAVVTLAAGDPDGDAITLSASVVGGGQSQAYQLKQQLGLQYAGSYYTNAFGQNEKSLSSASGTWYCLFPNGQLRRFAGSMAATLQASNLVATLSTSIYADPSLLWNAQASGGPSLSLAGNRLTIQAPNGATGGYSIQVTASDGRLSTSRTFTVAIRGNTAPTIAPIAAYRLAAGRAYTITLKATDAQRDAIGYAASLAGSYAALPATLVVSGNRLTIHIGPDFAGSFQVQVAASDGALSSSATFTVTAVLPAGAKRLSGDFNGDGRPDAASFHAGGAWWVSLANADGTFVNRKWGQWSAATNWRYLAVGDFNGDGKSDVAGFNAGGRWWVGRSTGAAFVNQTWVIWSAASTWRTVAVGDFNGDGKTDILGFKTSGSLWVGVSSGTSFHTAFWTQWAPASHWTSFDVADIDGNGLVDFVGRAKDGNWYVAYSTGASFNSAIWDSASGPFDS